MKLSVVILCWNDLGVIADCLASIYTGTHCVDFEVIISDNGSTDGSIEFIRSSYPQVRVIENGRNLRFAKGNNVAIEASRGEYVLILNPDTIVHDGALDSLIAFADRHPEGGAFGCKVLNSDGSYQGCARPLPTLESEWIAAFWLKALGLLSDRLHAGLYWRWKGDEERTVGWLAGCFILFRGELLKRLGGFDPQFFYYYEDTDLCHRVWDAGYTVVYTPIGVITHLGGQSTKKRFPELAFQLDAQITRYRYFYNYYGERGVRSCRRSALMSLLVRRLGYGVLHLAKPSEALRSRLGVLRALFQWNRKVDPVRLVQNGEEPELDLKLEGRVMER